MVKLLTEPTELGQCYRVDLRLRPEGERGPTVPSLEAALHYYDVLGRTWERQAFVKARPVAGDLDLGQEFLAQLEPWIYRRYLQRADITGIKALKRRIEQRTEARRRRRRTTSRRGHGGIRDIEFVIQFLQLLNGGDLPQLRTGNTLDGHRRAGAVRLPDASGAVAAGGELPLPAKDRASAADHVRSANARAARRAGRAAQAGDADGLSRQAAGHGLEPVRDRLSHARRR